MKRIARLIVDPDVPDEDYEKLLFALQRDTPFASRGNEDLDRIDVYDPRKEDGLCHCDEPEVVRTTAKGTPAAREFCDCGGLVNGEDRRGDGEC